MINLPIHQPVICLMGPTASGKTHLAMQLAAELPLEIVSVDSALVYRGMDIGTAKPTQEELKKFPHHLINICEPNQPYSAGQFYQDAINTINEIHARNHIPLLVGGTMLYFNWLQQGFDQLPKGDHKIHAEISQRIQSEGTAVLHHELLQIDPQTASHIHVNDAQRIQRALTLYYSTGKTPAKWYALQTHQSLLKKNLQLIVNIERKQLHQRIEQRFDNMLAQGFISEVSALYQRGDLNTHLPAIKTVGYRQAWDYLAGEYDLPTLRQKAIIATRQLARRQLIWLRRWQNADWFDSQDSSCFKNILQACRSFLS